MKINSPYPGSPQAVLDGCRCPVIDNQHGRGYRCDVTKKLAEQRWALHPNCPLHGSAMHREPVRLVGPLDRELKVSTGS